MDTRSLPPWVTRLGRTAAGLWSGLWDAALPNACGVCRVATAAHDSVVCEACRETTSALLDVPFCGRCGRTLPTSAIHAEDCARCRTESFWNIAGVARVGRYSRGLPQLIVDLKLRGVALNAEYLGALLSEAIRRQPWGSSIEALVPVPSHWLRHWQRSTAHTTLLSEEVGRRLGIAVVRAVERPRPAPSQTTLDSKARRFENVLGCFDAARPRRWGARLAGSQLAIQGRVVCIVDNVLYTGATVCEVSKVCRRLGAAKIYVAVVSRPPAIDDPPMLSD